MPKSGSGWYFNMINDLMIEYGFDDVRKLKMDYNLENILLYYNCNIGELTSANIDPILQLDRENHSFTIKTHCGPGGYIVELQRQYQIKTIYIFRDPRAVALSVYDHGALQRSSGQNGSFASILSFEDSIEFAKQQFNVWKEWSFFAGTFLVKYEALLENPVNVINTTTVNLGITPDPEKTRKIVETNLVGKKMEMHFNVGEAYRYKRVWTAEQKKYANEELSDMIFQMGYAK